MATSGSEWLDGIAYRIWLTSQSVGARFVEVVEHPDVTVTQLGLAVHLDELGAMSASDLSRILKITPQGVSKALRQLEVLGWVSRSPHPDHGRIILFEITDAGRAIALQGRHDAARANREIETLLQAFDLSTLQAALSAVRRGLDQKGKDAGLNE
ncbi:DNA-binding transcriptional regulator, MarR family [Microbacterium sp. cf046]|nr:DNA-binding transcriptional regulator, MarR family [Microbacterium sp. cf046]